LERYGIKVDEPEYLKYFGKGARKNIKDGYVYSSYYPYLITGRCSNAFGGVNYAALNTTNGCRRAFVSRFDGGKLILIDYESFHLRLIADIIGYPQPKESFHQFLAKQYFGKEDITPEERKLGKQLTFQTLYQDSRDEVLPEFFHKIWHWIDTNWEEATKNGYYYTDFGRKIGMEHIVEPTKAKLFNYIVQSKESEVSLSAIHGMIPMFANTLLRPVLYTYDSILLDYSPNDGELSRVINAAAVLFGGKYPTRIYVGDNYHEMELYTANS
jgi:hypothetical protein